MLKREVAEMKIAIPTEGKGIEGVVSDVFGRAERFTVVQICNGSIVSAEVVDNPATSYKHGAGPIVVKMLVDRGVTAVAGKEFGVGVSTLLDQNDIKRCSVEAGTPVREAAITALRKLEAHP